MKTSSIISTLTSVAFSVVLASTAQAGHRHHHELEYARVVDVQPIYHRVAQQVPQQSCHYESVTTRDSHHTATVVGGILGAAIGHELGGRHDHQGAATVTGGLIGAAIGHDLSHGKRANRRQHREQVCHTRYHTEYTQHLMGYDVTYKHRGRLYRIQTNEHPGRRIAIDHHARPAYAYR